MTEALFIYGTLGPGKPNEHIMQEIGGEWHPAKVKGHLVNEGWGAEQGCPGIIPSPEGEWVNGHVFVSENLARHWRYLDSFEGEEYQRVKVNVLKHDGDVCVAYVYALKP